MKKSIVSLAFLVVFAASVRAQSPIITYQGAVSGPNGAAIHDSTYPVTVTLWTDSSGGTALWHDVFETQVKAGIFNIALGSQTPLPTPATMDRPLWLGVSFNGGAEARSLIGTVPMALNVADSSITTSKLADHSVTWQKMGTEYIPYIRVNGTKVETGRNPINFTGGKGLKVNYDSSSMSVVIQPDSSSNEAQGSKGASPLFVATNPCGTNSSGTNADSVYNTVSGGCSNDATATNGYATIGGGQSNKATATWSTVAGGDTNVVQGKLAFIGGGFLNTVSGDTSAIVGGDHNEIDQDGSVSFIGAGFHNLIQPGLTGLGQLGSGIVSGFNNTIYNFTSFIGAGVANRIGSGGDLEREDTIVPPYAGDAASAIVTGDSNFIDEGLSFIGGGALNSIYGGSPDPNFSVIVGGYRNTVRALYSGILGGTFDTVWLGSYYTAIAGGDSNFANGNSDFIGAGAGNESRGTGIFIGAGTYNEVGLSPHNPTGTSSSYSFIGSGERNSIDGAYSDHNVIVGGLRDSIIGGYNYLGFIGAGEGNVITGPFDTGSFIGSGAQSRIDSESSLSAIAGGESNYISAPYCFIGGGGGPQTGGPATLSFAPPMSPMRSMRIGSGSLAPSVMSYVSNNVTSPWGTIGGGYNNHVGDTAGSVLGGAYNGTSSVYSTIGGGGANFISINSEGAVVGGGWNNSILGPFSTIAGGFGNSMDDGSPSDTGSAILGGVNNVIYSNYSVLAGGLANVILSPFAITGGGMGNEIDTSGDTSVLVGGAGNYLTGTYSGILGGLNDTITSKLSFIGGGCFNKVLATKWGTVTGGCTNIVTDTFGFIGGGRHNNNLALGAVIGGGDTNLIDNYKWHGPAYYGVIAGGQLNAIEQQPDLYSDTGWVMPQYAGILGGFFNYAAGSFSAVSGGRQNNAYGKYANIPGGVGLLAGDYQTVIGRYNSGWAISHNSTNPSKFPRQGHYTGDDSSEVLVTQDYPVFIIGNGYVNNKDEELPSNAFEVTDGGHSIVHDMDSNHAAPITMPPTDGTRWPVYGGRYQENTVVAEGDVSTFIAVPPMPPTELNATNADYGVEAIFHPHVGEFIVCIRNVDTHGNPVSFANGFITATFKDADTSVLDSTLSCGTITATNLEPFSLLPGPYNGYSLFITTPPSAWFIIRTANASGCEPFDRPFYFKVCARPW